MNAKKLPSGSWRARVTYTDDEGHRVYKSFTCKDPTNRGKKLVEAEASAWMLEMRKEKNSDLTFGQCLDKYIKGREGILSPRTIGDYKRTRRLYLQSIMDIPLCDLTQEHVQTAINMEASHLSPKTVANLHGLVSAVTATYRPSFKLNTVLPKKVPRELYIPSDGDVGRLITLAREKGLEVPILLAAFGPMRRGEICALTSDDVHGNTVHVYKNMVIDEATRTWVVKAPKSFAGGRKIEYPSWVVDLFRQKKGRIVEMTPDALTAAFIRLRKKSDLPYFRFHDLRHYSASIQHALGVPDKYIMDRGGWSTRATLDKVYKHVLDNEKKRFSAVANDHFSEVCATECATK